MYRYIILTTIILINALTPTHAFNLTEKLAECQTHLNANCLTTGTGGTALGCYEAVLKQEPTNSEAWRGLDRIKARYQGWINRALNRGQQYKVQAYQASIGLVDDLKTRLQASIPNTPTSTKPDVFVQLGHSENVSAVAFSPDGKLALSGSYDETLKLWQVESGREIRTFKGHSDQVKAVAFSPDGKLALSGSRDGTTRLWNIQTGKEIAQMLGFENGEWVTITPEGP